MTRSPKKQRVLASFEVPVKVEVREPQFETLKTLAALDVERLSKGNHKIEIGFIKGGCCPFLMRAIVRNGMVTGAEVEPCEKHQAEAPPRDLLAVLEKVRKRVAAGRKWRPVPVDDLLRSRALIGQLMMEGCLCFPIYIFGHSLFCCLVPPWCWKSPIYTGPLN
ncbi:MAG TPA: hypothetical protein VHY79_14215 [Rhizomicrobium sp.]|jgi:hypothetical protein|nr:hypothetical protein [Rhizomicrobium sp.]